MRNLKRLVWKLIRPSLALISICLLLVCATSSPSYATSAEIWATPDGNVTMSREAAADILAELRALRSEREILIQALQDERGATARLITTVDEYRLQVQAEREASQTLIAELQAELKAERRRSKRNAVLGSLIGAAIVAIVF